ncbi:MAG: twin-arginine translocation signal domain-containing protein, partial [Luteimonas sp.]
MKDPTLDRREFLKGCCATAAIGAVGPGMLFSKSAYAAVNPYDTIVHIFLRGGIDGLNLVPPIDGNDRTFYEQARPNLNIAATGTYGALPLTLAGGAATGFGLHPSALGLRDIWNDGKLAIVHGCGLLTAVTRSHFDAQLYLDLGTPGKKGGGTGWITRAWETQPGSTGQEAMPELAVNSRTPASLLGATHALSMGSPSDFQLNAGAYQWQVARSNSPTGLKGINDTLAQIWAGRSRIENDGAGADESLRIIAQQPYTSTLPAGWPTSTFAKQLWTVTQSIRFNLGMRYATLDLGGWDTHDGQGTAGSGYNFYQNKIAELSQALTAFYTELNAGGEIGRVTVV